MARLNVVHYKGIVKEAPHVIRIDGRDYLKFTIKTSRSVVMVIDGKKELEYDEPDIMLYDRNIDPEIRNLQEGDVVYIRGVVTTKRTQKTIKCPECGHTQETLITPMYTTPTFVEKLSHLDSEEEKESYMMKVRHVSNEVYLMGRLARDPARKTPKTGIIITQYQIAINRSFRIDGDPPELKADYPWVKSYGEDAEEDMFRLKTGSIILISGMIKTRNAPMYSICEKCGFRYDYTQKVNEVVPASTEYIANFRDDDEVERLKEEGLQQSFRDKYGYAVK